MRVNKKLGWLLTVALVMPAMADEGEVVSGDGYIPLTAATRFIHVMQEGKAVKVERVQDPDYELKGYYAKTARKCPPFCIQPEHPVEGVETIGEVEMFQFMENQLRDGTGLLIDARTPEWYKRGTIPGSLNYPFTVLTKDAGDPQMADALKAFGAKPRGEVNPIQSKIEELGFLGGDEKTDKWDFSEAKELVLWCNGPSCGQSPRAIRGLAAVGYPLPKLKYYRGGMQLWQLWGLTTVVPGQ